MNPTERRRAFDRFWRGNAEPASAGGSGLGLAIAQNPVRADRGDIELARSAMGIDCGAHLRR
jgi:signal transduction histidine kinase